MLKVNLVSSPNGMFAIMGCSLATAFRDNNLLAKIASTSAAEPHSILFSTATFVSVKKHIFSFIPADYHSASFVSFNDFISFLTLMPHLSAFCETFLLCLST